MKQELCAYLIRDDGRVSDMPTDELLGALDQVKRGSTVQGQNMSSDKEAVYAFLQALKRTMRASKDVYQAS